MATKLQQAAKRTAALTGEQYEMMEKMRKVLLQARREREEKRRLAVLANGSK